MAPGAAEDWTGSHVDISRRSVQRRSLPWAHAGSSQERALGGCPTDGASRRGPCQVGTKGGDMAPRPREPPKDQGSAGVILDVITYHRTCSTRLPKYRLGIYRQRWNRDQVSHIPLTKNLCLGDVVKLTQQLLEKGPSPLF